MGTHNAPVQNVKVEECSDACSERSEEGEESDFIAEVIITFFILHQFLYYNCNDSNNNI